MKSAFQVKEKVTIRLSTDKVIEGNVARIEDDHIEIVQIRSGKPPIITLVNYSHIVSVHPHVHD